MQIKHGYLWSQTGYQVLFEKLKTTLIRQGYKSTKLDNSLFTKFHNATVMYILVYVDDFIVTGNSNEEIRHLIV